MNFPNMAFVLQEDVYVLKYKIKSVCSCKSCTFLMLLKCKNSTVKQVNLIQNMVHTITLNIH